MTNKPLFGPEGLLVGIYPPYTVLEVGSYTQQSVVGCSSVYGADAYTPSHSSSTTIKYLSTNHCFRSGLSNSTNSTKQCYCYKMYQLVKEKEPSAGNDAGSQKVHNHLGVTKRKVESCDTAETTCQSLKIINNDKSGSTRQRITVHAVTQSHPSPVLSLVESVPQGAHITHIKVDNLDKRAHNEPSSSKVLQDVHISGQLMEDFLELAKDNTDKDLETCGVLGAFLENGTFYVTTLIIPKQDSSSNSCQAVNEEEVFAIQNERSLFPVGWIHTHPSQSCFMSSIDLHTQYSYQAMVPEAFAIVVAPTDSSRSSGIFRLTDPCGMSVLKNCQEDGFHPHKEPADGSPIYEDCSNVYTNSNLRFEIFDLR